MNEKEKQVVLRHFISFYNKAELEIPSIERREFGIGNIKKIDARHLSFSSTSDFRSYLVSNTPMFVSHSTAYYRYPDATPIQKKVWEGADLVFDLDIHAEGKYGPYAYLDRVKEDAIRLVEEFLTSDFGISKKDITMNFSGNRGYHIHVQDRNFQGIGSDERKEIVDYIMGTGLDYRAFFELDSERPNDRINKGPKPDDGGYRGRFARSVVSVLEKDPKSISRVFSKEDTRKRLIDGINIGNWNSQPFKTNDFIGRLAPIAATLGLVSVNTDAGVTQDLSKLIRVPGSIHGDTGLVAKKVAEIDKFDPFSDAVIQTSETLKVKFVEDVPELTLLGERLGQFKKDDEKEMNKSVALFYLLKGSALIKE